MNGLKERFLFACAPDSWGVLDYPGPSWEQSYENMLDEMVEAGYTGTELGPYGFFPTDPAVLKPQLEKRKLKLLGSFVPVKMTDPAAGKAVIERIRKVGHLLATLKAPFLVMADDQSPERNAFSGRVYDKACPTLTPKKSHRNSASSWFSTRTSPPTWKRPKSVSDFSMRRRMPKSGCAWIQVTVSTATAIP